MHPKTGNQTLQKQHQHPVMQVLKKYDHFTKQIATANRNVRSAYNTTTNVHNFTVLKSKSAEPSKTFPNITRRNNANRNTPRSASPIGPRSREENTKVIFERLDPLNPNAKANVKKIVWTNNEHNNVIKKETQKPQIQKAQVQKTHVHKAQNSQTPKKYIGHLTNTQHSKKPVLKSTRVLPPCEHRVNKTGGQPQNKAKPPLQQLAPVAQIPHHEHGSELTNKNSAFEKAQAMIRGSSPKNELRNTVQTQNRTELKNSDIQQTQPKVVALVASKHHENLENKNVQPNTANNSSSSGLQETVSPESPKKNEQIVNKSAQPLKQNVNKKNSPQKANTTVGAPQENKDPKENIEVIKPPQLPRQYPSEYPPDSQNPANLSFKKVTQELANIIKNFQKQIHDVPISQAPVEQVPSAMIQPKTKEFFKTPPTAKEATPKTPANNSNNSANTNQNNHINPNNNKNQNNNNKNQNNRTQASHNSNKTTYTFNNLNKKSSTKSLSTHGSVLTKRSSIAPFRSLTQHNMLISSTSVRGFTRKPLYTDPLKQLKDEVQVAIRERKTFTVRGQFQAIRKALLARGWVEKYHMSYKDQLHEDMKRFQNYSIPELIPLMRREELATVCKNLIKSKLLGGYQVDFYWGINDEAFKENPDKIKYTIINKLKREIFSYTNKQGLCDASKFSYWYQKSDVSKLNHPRTYSLGKNGDVRGFIEDFHFTAAMSLLKWVVKMSVTKECKVMSAYGKIPLEVFDFALNECCKFIKRARHEDIDMQIPDATENEWNQFLDYFYKLVHYNNHFRAEGKETEDSIVRKSNYILNNLRSFYHFVDMDGMMNIWILKPTASSRGRGIHMCRTLQYVLKIIKQNCNVRYIIQKYIERPLLIYNTKFDIRQWFVISNCYPLTIWMYKECYLRFSSQTYNLRKLHESIHLTNNSVQCKYKSQFVDAALPSYNMWDSHEFEKYLTNIGYPKAFSNIIYPGMKQSITAAVLMHQEKMVIRRNSFELYGADFILTEDFQPWLLEINSSPALYGSTPVTARMCPKVLEDVIKVVVDHARNNKASTGSFEMIYKQQLSKLPAPAPLEVKGTPLKSGYFFNGPDQELQDKLPMPTFSDPLSTMGQTQDCLKMFGEEIKKTLKNLLQIIQNEKHKRGLEESVDENLRMWSNVSLNK